MPTRAANILERLRASLVTHDRPILAEALPNLVGPAAALESWFLVAPSTPATQAVVPTQPEPLPSNLQPMQPSGAATVAPQPAQQMLPPHAPVAGGPLAFVEAFGRAIASSRPTGHALPSSTRTHDPLSYVANLHRKGLLPVALWDTFSLSRQHPTAIVVQDESTSSTLLAALTREVFGRFGLAGVLLTNDERAEAVDALLAVGQHRQRPYPPPPWRPGAPSPNERLLDGRRGPPNVGHRLAMTVGGIKNLKTYLNYLKAVETDYGTVAILVDGPILSGLSDTLVEPEIAAKELMALFGEITQAVGAYILVVGNDDVTAALATLLKEDAAQATAALSLVPKEERFEIDAIDMAPGGRSAHLKLDVGIGWMWATWQSESIPAVDDLGRLAEHRERRS